jgi:hypothetical protein
MAKNFGETAKKGGKYGSEHSIIRVFTLLIRVFFL